jgi:hypothetical protein
LVTDDGYLIITTPNMNDPLNRLLGARSPSIKIPQHTIYFDTDTLTAALSANFELVSSVRDYQYISVSRLIERVAHIFKCNLRLTTKLNMEVLVPNGMFVYIFKKKGK